MSQDLKLDQLESTTEETATTTTAKAAKVMTDEDVANLEAAVVKIGEFGVSENFAKVLPLVAVWHDTELSAPVKEEVIAAFGTSAEFKDYIGAEFSDELAVIASIAKAASTLNNIKSFYKRRGDGTTKSKKKEKMMQINIGGEPYTISQVYYESIAALTAPEKRELVLAHPLTKKAEALEVL